LRRRGDGSSDAESGLLWYFPDIHFVLQGKPRRDFWVGADDSFVALQIELDRNKPLSENDVSRLVLPLRPKLPVNPMEAI
jgi:hypothetical protein